MKTILQRNNEVAMCGDGLEFYCSARHISHTLIFDPPWNADIDFGIFKSESILAFTDGRRAGDIINLFGAPTWVFVWDCVSSWYTPNRPLQRMKMCFWYGQIDDYNQKGHLMGGPCGKPRMVTNTRGSYLFVPDSGKMLSDMYQQPITSLHAGDVHKHSKPREWMTALIANTYRQGDAIIDPFFGGGASLSAARRLGIPWAGCEIDKTIAENLDRSATALPTRNPDQLTMFSHTSNAKAQLTPEQPKAAEGTRSAAALWAVNCSDPLGTVSKHDTISTHV